MTAFIDPTERVVTCEDAAELQLQQPHVVRLETRPPNLEGQGQITMRDLVKNCLRMRPERIIVGEVRGPEAFDLLQAMNTGHDGSMGTLHANSPARGDQPPGIDDHHGRLRPALEDHPRDDRRLHRRDHPGRAPARRLAPHHPHHRGGGAGRRRDHHPGPVRLRDHRRGRARQGHRAATAPPASPARASGTAPATTAWSASWPKPWTRRSRRVDRTSSSSAVAVLAFVAVGGVGWAFAGGDGVGARPPSACRPLAGAAPERDKARARKAAAPTQPSAPQADRCSNLKASEQQAAQGQADARARACARPA